MTHFKKPAALYEPKEWQFQQQNHWWSPKDCLASPLMLFPPVHPLRGDASFHWTGHLVGDKSLHLSPTCRFFQLHFKQLCPEGQCCHPTCAMKQMIKGWYAQTRVMSRGQFVLMDRIRADTGSLSLSPSKSEDIVGRTNPILNTKILGTVKSSVFSSTSYFLLCFLQSLRFQFISIKYFPCHFVLPKVQLATLTWFQLLLSLVRTEAFHLRKGLPVCSHILAEARIGGLASKRLFNYYFLTQGVLQVQNRSLS